MKKYKKHIKLLIILLVFSFIFGTIPSTQAMFTKGFLGNASVKSAEYNNFLGEKYPAVLTKGSLTVPFLNNYDYGLLIKTNGSTDILDEYIKIIPNDVFKEHIFVNGQIITNEQSGEFTVPLKANIIELSFESKLDLSRRIKLFFNLIFGKLPNNSYIGSLKVYTSNNYLIDEIKINFSDLSLATNFGSLRLNAIVFSKSIMNLDYENDTDINKLQNYLNKNLYKYVIEGNSYFDQEELQYTSELMTAFGRDNSLYELINISIENFVDEELYNISTEFDNLNMSFNNLNGQFNELLEQYNSLEPTEPFSEPIFVSSDYSISNFENILYNLLNDYLENATNIFEEINIQEIQNMILINNQSRINSVVNYQQNISSTISNIVILQSAIEEIQNAISILIANKDQTIVTSTPPVEQVPPADQNPPAEQEPPVESTPPVEPIEPLDPIIPVNPSEPFDPIAPVDPEPPKDQAPSIEPPINGENSDKDNSNNN